MSQTSITENGTVCSFNLSPKGTYEGFILQLDKERVQVNFPREMGAEIARVAPEGSVIELQARREEKKEHAAHPVFRLLSITNKSKQTLSVREPHPEKAGHFSGKVARLNYALHGEVNGAILGNGDFVHLKPHGAAVVNLTAGLRVEGLGTIQVAPAGHRVIEAEEVNGIRIEKKHKPEKKKPGHK